VAHLLRGQSFSLGVFGCFRIRRHNTSLQELDLNDNRIGNAGATAMWEGLRYEYALERDALWFRVLVTPRIWLMVPRNHLVWGNAAAFGDFGSFLWRICLVANCSIWGFLLFPQAQHVPPDTQVK